MARLISRRLHLSRLLGSSLFAVIIAFGQGAWAQSLAAPDKEIRAEDATVTGGILRTPLYKDSVMLNPATGLEETVPLVVDNIDIPVEELHGDVQQAVRARAVPRRTMTTLPSLVLSILNTGTPQPR